MPTKKTAEKKTTKKTVKKKAVKKTVEVVAPATARDRAMAHRNTNA